MNVAEFRKRGKEMIDYIADYLEETEKLPVPGVKPGYLQELIPEKAPEDPENWEDVFKDVDRVIMPGMAHLHNPHFHGFFPTASSYPGLLGAILTDGFGCLGSTWATSPACTELEVVMVNWLAKMLLLPEDFLFSKNGKGGGVILGSGSEFNLISLLCARAAAINKFRKMNPDETRASIMSRLVAYSSDQAHVSVEKSGLWGAVVMKLLPTDNKGSLRGATLQDSINSDRANGLIPFYVAASLGTTGVCAFDNLKEIGPVCSQEGLWLHIDAAYAGSAFICPEFRPLLDGVEHAATLGFNAHKWLLVNHQCSVMWIRDKTLLTEPFDIPAMYMQSGIVSNMPDYRKWEISTSHPFRSLKLWFVLRLYGKKALQEHIRKDIRLAHTFEEYVKTDNRFEIVHEVVLGVVLFRLKGTNSLTEKLLEDMNADRRLYFSPGMFKGNFVIRFVLCGSSNTPESVKYAWKVIQEVAFKVADGQC